MRAQESAMVENAASERSVDAIRARLFALQDPAYRDFQSRLIPAIDPSLVVGVRTPALRALAKELAETPAAAAFLRELPHTLYEENNLHAFLIERLRDFDEAAQAVDAFLPFVNNWATCDSMSPKVFAKHPDELRAKIDGWMASDAAFTVRFGIGMLMRHFLDERFEPNDLENVASVASSGWDEAPGTARHEADCVTHAQGAIPDASYYVNMMRAWYFATALAKQPEATLPFIEMRRLDPWTHNKAIQKAVESRRIDADLKAHVRTLRVT